MNIGKRIKDLREEKNLTQKEFAHKIGVSVQAVSAWESGIRHPNSTQRKKIWEFFSVTEAELFGGSSKKDLPAVQKIPVISWVHANKFEEINDPFPVGISDEYIYSDIKGEHIFALRVQNNCMEPEFLEGDTIIVQPSAAVTSGDYIIVADRESNTATFKQLKQYGNKKILHPLNPKYNDIELDHKKQYVVVGKIVEKIKKY